MKKLRTDVRRLVIAELDRANKEFPLFRSVHEAYGVIAEEVNELDLALGKTKLAYQLFESTVFDDMAMDDKLDAISAIRELRRNAIETACEAIQVAAMATKWTMGTPRTVDDGIKGEGEDNFSQEHADMLAEFAEGMTESEKDIFICEAPTFLKGRKVAWKVSGQEVKSVVDAPHKAIHEEDKDAE